MSDDERNAELQEILGSFKKLKAVIAAMAEIEILDRYKPLLDGMQARLAESERLGAKLQETSNIGTSDFGTGEADSKNDDFSHLASQRQLAAYKSGFHSETRNEEEILRH